MLDETFLTTDDVLGYLRVNLRTVYRLIKAGKIPAVRVGRQWRFRKSDLDAWLESQRAGRAAGKRRRVLLATEDEPDRPLTAALMAAGYDIAAVTDGPAALDRLRRDGADLLITGLRLSGMDGLAVIREARRSAPRLPVIILTAFSSESSAIEAANLGVAGYLTAPFTAARVLSATARVLGE